MLYSILPRHRCLVDMVGVLEPLLPLSPLLQFLVLYYHISYQNIWSVSLVLNLCVSQEVESSF